MKKPADQKVLTSPDLLGSKIITIRGQKVMLDEDLAALYGVTTKRLNEQVKRNAVRFPEDFMLRLTSEEFRQVTNLRSQIATSSGQYGGRRHLPLVFTEHGALMLRTVLSETSELARKLDELDRKYSRHDAELKVVFNTLREMMRPPREEAKPPSKRRIGFDT